MRASFWLDEGINPGSVVLWIESPCGPRQVIQWENIEDLKKLSDMLLDFYWKRKMEKLETDNVAEQIIRQVFEGE